MAGKIVKKPKADAENTEVVENAEVAETTKQKKQRVMQSLMFLQRWNKRLRKKIQAL